MAPVAWQKRYYQDSKRKGKELLLLQKSGKHGVWTAMDPDFRVTTVELKATSEVPLTGIQYQLVPLPTTGQKTAAMSSSKELVAAGVTGSELTQFRETSTDAIAVALVAGLGSPKQLVRLIKWGCQNRRNMATVVSLALAFGFVLKSTGVLDAIVFFTTGVITWAKVTRDTYVETNEWVAELWAEHGWILESMKSTSWEAWTCLGAMAFALWLNWGEKGDDSPSSSTTSSGRATPVPDDQMPAESQIAVDPNMLLLEAVQKLQSEQEAKWSSFLGEAARGQAVEQAEKTQLTDEAEENRKEIRRLRSRIDAFETAAAKDLSAPMTKNSGLNTPPKQMPTYDVIPGLLVGAPGLAGERLVDTHTSLPCLSRGNEDEGEPEIEVAKTKLPVSVASIIQELEQKAVNALDMVKNEIGRYREVAEKDWPLPKGFRSRVAPSLLPELYKDGRRGEETAQRFLEDHGLKDCYTAKEMVNLAAQFDRMLLMDKQPGFINLPSTEYLARRYYGLMVAFEECTVKNDWCKPKDAKNWKSKVNWHACDRIDPRAGSKTFKVKELEEEVTKSMEQDALLARAQDRLTQAVGSGEREVH